jgi:hypothetical protein
MVTCCDENTPEWGPYYGTNRRWKCVICRHIGRVVGFEDVGWNRLESGECVDLQGKRDPTTVPYHTLLPW